MNEAPAGELSTARMERRHANISPLLLVLKYQQQTLTSLSALFSALMVVLLTVLAIVMAARHLSGNVQPGLSFDRFSVMNWVVVFGSLLFAVLIVAFIPKPARIPFVVIGSNILGVFGLIWLGIERLVNRLGKGGGIVGLLLGLFMLLYALISLDTSLGALLRTMDEVANSSPVVAGLIVVLGLPLALLPWYVVWVVLRAAITILRLSGRERLLLRDVPAGAALITRMWGMPPTVGFARQAKGRFAAIVVFSVLAAFFFSLAAVVIVASPSFLHQFDLVANRCLERGGDTCLQDRYPLFLLGSSITAAALLAVFAALGALCQRAVRRRLRFSLEELQKVDARAPVLFLRAFGDDQVPLPPSRVPWITRLLEAGRRRTSLDQMLLDEATSYGPVVALGKPGDKHPPYGAARGYFENRDWQDAVADLAQRGTAVVLCLDDTDGIWWEVEHLVATRHLRKTLFLIHPKHADAQSNARIIGKLLPFLALGSAAAERLLASPPQAGKGKPETPIGFFLAKDGTLQVIRSRTHAQLAYLLTLRMFLRERLELATQRL